MSQVFVLENDPERIRAMKASLAKHLPDVSATFIDNAPEAISWLKEHLSVVKVISLDHDLGEEIVRNGEPFNPGSGRDVAGYLAALTPCCQVIVHTDNLFVRRTIQGLLTAGGWNHRTVAPGNLTAWVEREWIGAVAELYLGAPQVFGVNRR
jgi:hypothetical protein